MMQYTDVEWSDQQNGFDDKAQEKTTSEVRTRNG